ncbi:2-phosphosulfolactate phosphatase [Natroniella sulfidigena]|uniref:2-phosphosulfolactate phosphatase n=1 Tax=Natroniella sulfidigena TaxID=723921 RepID=UPI00200A951F|nr:2-phosphosulfolactate phosphatase [Natroniella sulfidigena]MCK8817424.1 2-phosphosulfolactate phosphatase [Natroniella sulfidigena]
MKIDLIFSATDIKREEVKNKAVVVIDTLRATSTIITALAQGCSKVIPVAEIKEARKLSKNLKKDCLLAGERQGIKIDGFDLGNSPRDYTAKKVAGKVIVLTTTNGTQCFKRLIETEEILVASLLNVEQVSARLESKKEVVFCCAGVAGQFALDDFITAGKIIAELVAESEVSLSDRALVAYQTYLQNKNGLRSILKRSQSGRNLISLGKEGDIDYIVEHQKDYLPYYENGEIK